MDINRTIEELYQERARLEALIRTLEAYLENPPAGKKPRPEKKRRGRKSMGQEERLRVSQRMREYWRARRSQ